MADLSDVTAALATMATNAVYPNGTGQPSVAARDVRVFEGWPLATQLDDDIGAGKALVSVFPMAGTGDGVDQVFEPEYPISAPLHGIAATLNGQTVSLSGTPRTGEYVTIIADHSRIYSRVGADLPTILAAILADATADYPSASVSGDTITFPTDQLTVRVGVPVPMARLLHRQRQQVMITAWTPDPTSRREIAAAIDVLFKQNLRLTFADSSQAIMTYSRTNTSDQFQKVAIYRRDLIFTVLYGTVEEFTGYEVTSVTVSGGQSIPAGSSGVGFIA